MSNIYDYLANIASCAFDFIEHTRDKTSAIDSSIVSIEASYQRRLIRVMIVYDDIPFVPDSIRAMLQTQNVNVFRSNLLPNFQVSSDISRTFEQLEMGGKSLYWLDLEMLSHQVDCKDLESKLNQVLSSVKCVVKDWRRMQDALRMVMYAWQDQSTELVSDAIVQENLLLMEWMLHHFLLS